MNRSGILDVTVVLLLISRATSVLFSIAATNSQSLQQDSRLPFSPHSHQWLLPFIILKINILTVVQRNLIVVLICMPSMSSGVEHFVIYACCPFVCLLWRTVFSVSLPIFKSSCICCFYRILSCIHSLYSLAIDPLSDICFPIICCHV